MALEDADELMAFDYFDAATAAAELLAAEGANEEDYELLGSDFLEAEAGAAAAAAGEEMLDEDVDYLSIFNVQGNDALMTANAVATQQQQQQLPPPRTSKARRTQY
jgi:hypothetical protein